jgi:glutamate/tyrosine decarboxylase-like PLP-dependent enzyme
MTDDRSELADLLDATRDAALDFLAGLRRRPAALPPKPPEPLELPAAGTGAKEALALFRRRYEAGLSGSPGPRYLGFVTGGSTPAAIAGDWLAAAYDQNLSNDGDSIATTVEREALGMLRSLFSLPDGFRGAFVSGATQANTVALATAREWALRRRGVDASRAGLWRTPPVPVLGGAPHASVEKAVSMLGMGRECVERVPCLPGRTAVDPRALGERLAAQGDEPAIVVASAGEVNTGDFDDLTAVGDLCRRHGAWLHVDGAFGLFAACDPELAPLLRGLEAADSVATDGHKWLNVPYDSGVVFTRHLELQEAVFKASAAYLGDGDDLLHRTPENSRRFRALPAWMTLTAYGRDGYRELVRRCCRLARRLGEGIDSSPTFELLSPVRLDVVCFALAAGGAEHRDRFLRDLTADGRVFLTPTTYQDRPGLRAAFVNWLTDDADVELILEALEEIAADR